MAREFTQRDLEAMGTRALAIRIDVADPVAVEDAAHRVEEELGEIDVWVINAMATVFAPVWATNPDEYRRATEVTYLGAVWGTLAALRNEQMTGEFLDGDREGNLSATVALQESRARVRRRCGRSGPFAMGLPALTGTGYAWVARSTLPAVSAPRSRA